MPVLARVYGVPVREQASLTLQQFRDLQYDFRKLTGNDKEVTPWPPAP